MAPTYERHRAIASPSARRGADWRVRRAICPTGWGQL